MGTGEVIYDGVIVLDWTRQPSGQRGGYKRLGYCFGFVLEWNSQRKGALERLYMMGFIAWSNFGMYWST